ncbi:hypothetical protein BD324DRAFT_620775 [Kockovaella imperatae]|uniref:U3 small nucleolar RNA-associated protein 25 n=1 Tax=Kockovaella imperatae TaxID=4999 RepID=A0A1Y1ULQ6_9TREE|nr:hypothetical protein BD324DRAFT_620775 [Kockovaella imperatae]ORX38416.1 hypothetical protein BD324DRAFT_620775 [Kockovaella imperatae]
MSSKTEVKLLTLLNVSAIKKPRALDKPGGYRGSPLRSTLPLSSIEGTNGDVQSPASVKRARKSVSAASQADVSASEDAQPVKRRKSVVFAGEIGPSGSTYASPIKSSGNVKGKGKAKEVTSISGSSISSKAADGVSKRVVDLVDDEDDEEVSPMADAEDMFNVHFGSETVYLTAESIAKVNEDDWTSGPVALAGFGKAVSYLPGAGSPPSPDVQNRIIPSLLSSVRESDDSMLVSQATSHLGTYKDIYLHSLDDEADGSEKILYGPQKGAIRQAIMVHALNHVLKTRRRIIRNNEKLAHAAEGQEPLEPPRDQSFTRPKVLLLLPLRSLALHYLKNHLFPLAPAGTQIENQRPFISSFSLSSDLTDPLAAPSALSSYPADHIVNFQGNSDDNFRFGIKITRKAWRIVMMPADEKKLLDCDFIIASPLGMKMAAEREKSTDMLSSIEVCVVDGMDIMQMQNWDHVQFIFDNLNKIPEDPHGCDFSRLKPWYLDQQAKYLRQTILLSRYDSPEGRALFHRKCSNLAGKIRTDDVNCTGVLDRVKFGVRQTFERIDLEGAQAMDGEEAVSEIELRLDWFTKKTVPSLVKSAMTRQNTLIVVPSYFDFVRLTNYLRKNETISFAAISEYSSNTEISRARTEFFKGKKPFLILTERFHFYRRYKIRGAKTLVFYSLPDHAQFYSEFLQTPFLPSQKKQKALKAKEKRKRKRKSEGGEESEDEQQDEADDDDEDDEVDPDAVSCRVLFSRFDYLKLERVVGTVNARLMLTKGEAKFQFI